MNSCSKCSFLHRLYRQRRNFQCFSTPARLLRKYAPDLKTRTLTIYRALLQDPQTSKAASVREIRGISPDPGALIVSKVFCFTPVDRFPQWLGDFRCGAPWFPTSPKSLVLRFPSPSWAADAGLRISPNSSPIKSRTSAINHLASCFRFRWEEEEWCEECGYVGMEPLSYRKPV